MLLRNSPTIMRFLLFTPLIESALLKMRLKVERPSLQFINLNLLRIKGNKTELSEALPFQSLFGWFILSSGGRTKDLLHTIYFGILSKILIFKIQPVGRIFFATRKNISCTPCTPKISFLNALNHISVNSKYIQVI